MMASDSSFFPIISLYFIRKYIVRIEIEEMMIPGSVVEGV
jgi:hypothetical protein